MIKKFGICFFVISLVAGIFCSSVFASNASPDGGGSEINKIYAENPSKLPFPLPTLADIQKDVESKFSDVPALDKMCLIKNSDTYYSFYVTCKSGFQFSNNTLKNPIISSTSFNPAYAVYYDVIDGKKLSLSNVVSYSSGLSSIALGGTSTAVYTNHDIAMKQGNNVINFFVPQWNLEGIARTPLTNLMKDFFKDSGIVLKVGLTVFSSLLGIILLKWLQKSLI